MRYDVTIGIPVYNVENYIHRTLESALAQTYPDIEFLVIDDGSDDKSYEILKSFQSNHPRGKALRILSHRQNLGVSETRNQIIDEASGEYLYFLDSDDVIDKDTITLLKRHLDDNNADAVFGSYERVELSGTHTLFQYSRQFFDQPDAFAAYAYSKYAAIQASACNFLFRLSLVRNSNLRFYKSDFWEDTVFTLSLATIVQRVVLLPNITYTYLCRDNSLSNSWHNDDIPKERILRYFQAVGLLKQNSLQLKEKSYYPNRCYIAVMSDIYIICNVLKKQRFIVPSFTNQELHSYLRHPASFSEIMLFSKMRLQNLLLFFVGKLPAHCCIFLIRCYARLKGLL